MSRQKGDIMKIIKHGKLFEYLRPQKKYYVLCPDCGRRVYCLPEYPSITACKCECEFEYDKNDLTEDIDRRWFPTDKEPRQTADTE